MYALFLSLSWQTIARFAFRGRACGGEKGICLFACECCACLRACVRWMATKASSCWTDGLCRRCCTSSLSAPFLAPEGICLRCSPALSVSVSFPNVPDS